MVCLTACGRQEPYGTSCDESTGECEEYDSAADMLEAARQDRLARKQRATRLFVDYRDPVFAVLETYLGKYRNPEWQYRIYVSIFDEEMDQALRMRLAQAGIVIEPGWECIQSTNVQQAVHDENVQLMCISIPEVRSIGDSKYQLTLEHFETASIDHMATAIAIVQLRGDRWTILELAPG